MQHFRPIFISARRSLHSGHGASCESLVDILLLSNPSSASSSSASSLSSTANGTASTYSLCKLFISQYSTLDDARRLSFLRHLSSRHGPDLPALSSYLTSLPSPPSVTESTASTLNTLSLPRYASLFPLLQSQVPTATPTLISLRHDCLRLKGPRPLAVAMKGHLARSFAPGMVELRRITYEATPASGERRSDKRRAKSEARRQRRSCEVQRGAK